jgi:predicted phosphohydrolase
MVQIAWVTDPHLNFLPPGGAVKFGEGINPERDDEVMLLVTGDIAEASSLVPLLKDLAQGFPNRIAFTLGNHDYYGGSFASVRRSLEAGLPKNLVWLDGHEPILLDDTTALVGHQGWFDGLYGDPIQSRVVMADFELIEDLRPHYNSHVWPYYGEPGRMGMLEFIRSVSKDSAEQARVSLLAALKLRRDVIFGTHFPPFRGACWHQGELSNSHWMPWFTSKAMGDMLDEVAFDHPDNRILVLCGHTHSQGVYEHAPNLRVFTGKANYGHPDVASTIFGGLDPVSHSLGR